MAAFLNRGLALAPDKTPVANADKVDGMDASEFVPRWALVQSDGTLVAGSGAVSVTRSGAGLYFVTFDGPVSGHAIIAGISRMGAERQRPRSRPRFAETRRKVRTAACS